MLRAAQMLMGYTMRVHYLGKDWRLPSRNREAALLENDDYCNITEWFTDYPGYPHIFSLQHLLQCGMKYDKLPGEWFGPSTAAQVFRDLAHLQRLKYGGPLEVLVTQGDTIYTSEAEGLCGDLALNSLDSLLRECAARHQGSPLLSGGEEEGGTTVEPARSCASQLRRMAQLAGQPRGSPGPSPFFDPLLHPPPSTTQPWACSLLVLVPLRLGIHSVNPDYFQELKDLLRCERCVGIVGGRPHHAIYFVGYRGDELLGLDPHTVFRNPPPSPCRPHPNPNPAALHEYISQVHVRESRDLVRLPFSQLDPSLAVGLYFRDRDEFEVFCEQTRTRAQRAQQDYQLARSQGRPASAPPPPLFVVQHSAPAADALNTSDSEDERGSSDVEDDYVLV